MRMDVLIKRKGALGPVCYLVIVKVARISPELDFRIYVPAGRFETEITASEDEVSGEIS